MTNESELLPCPFCGNDGTGPVESALHISHTELEWRASHDSYSVQCDRCTATMGYSDSAEEAITAWNTRALPSEAVSAGFQRSQADSNAGWRLVPVEDAANIADDLAEVAYRRSSHPQALTIDTNDAWRRVGDAARDIADGIRALPTPFTPEASEQVEALREAERRGEQRAIARLVNVSRAIGFQAGVGGRETAGAIASYLATSPDEIAPFMDGELSPLDFKGDWMRGGCLTWHGGNGKVVSPEDCATLSHAEEGGK